MTVLGRVEQLWAELTEARTDIEEIRGQFLTAIVIARDAGITQPAIAERLGLTKQWIGVLERKARER